MKLSQAGLGTLRINNLDKMFPVQDILMQTNQIMQYSAGIYALDNIPLLIKEHIERVIRRVFKRNGLVEVVLPTLQPQSIWELSGRWEKYNKDGTMLTVKTDKMNYGMAPTAEEAIVEFVKNRKLSYKCLPFTFYQIGEKYRNEIRNRGYLLRSKSFPMMDAYSFNLDSEDLQKSYAVLKQAYIDIFEELELPVIPVAADNGAIGGKCSEEFMFLSDSGEDTILVDELTGKAVNTEVLEKEDAKEYLSSNYGIDDIKRLVPKKAIELGHIFQLGTFYSQTMNLNYTNANGETKPYYMGCYGIGITRTLATIFENAVIKNGDKIDGFALPLSIAPYKLQIVAKPDSVNKNEIAEQIYTNLIKSGIDCILDDRTWVSMGSKIRDCKVLGTPYIAILGDKTQDDEVELENVKTGEKRIVKISELTTFFKK